jgi:DNA modification methylase
VEVFREVWRVLREDGVLWVNIGDSYAQSEIRFRNGQGNIASPCKVAVEQTGRRVNHGLKPKDLVGIPWMLAFALRADGWYLRSDIIWSKPNPMPESVTDRPTKAHEYLFLLTKSERYFYDAEAIKEPGAALVSPDANGSTVNGGAYGRHVLGAAIPEQERRTDKQRGHSRRHAGFNDRWDAMEKADQCGGTKNKRDVWTIATQAFPEAHFATYPEKLVEPCILAGTSEKGCCPECGAPWRRVTERTKRFRERPNDLTKRTGEDGTGNFCPNTVDGVDVRTVGWEPTCTCPAHEPTPCTVLDPFGGSGTTAAVACRLGRRAVICELNPEYVAIATRRIETALRPGTYRDDTKDGDAPLFAVRAASGEPVPNLVMD